MMGHPLQKEESKAHQTRRSMNAITVGRRSPKSDLYRVLGFTCTADSSRSTSASQKKERKKERKKEGERGERDRRGGKSSKNFDT